MLAETIPGVPDQLTGPVAALVLAILVIVALVKAFQILWSEHLKADQDDRDARDRYSGQLDVALKNNTDAIAAWNKRNEQDAARARRTDRGG